MNEKFFGQNSMYLFRTLDPHPPTATPFLGQSHKKTFFFLNNWMVIFTKKFGTLDPHLPIVCDKVPKKRFFLGTFPNIANIAPSSNPWSPSNAIKYSKKETEDSLLDTFDNIEEEEFFEVEKKITSSQKINKKWHKPGLGQYRTDSPPTRGQRLPQVFQLL